MCIDFIVCDCHIGNWCHSISVPVVAVMGEGVGLAWDRCVPVVNRIETDVPDVIQQLSNMVESNISHILLHIMKPCTHMFRNVTDHLVIGKDIDCQTLRMRICLQVIP